MTVLELKNALDECNDDDLVIVLVDNVTCNIVAAIPGGLDTFHGATELTLD